MRHSLIALAFAFGCAFGTLAHAPALPAPVWALPETGEQSLVVTGIVDGDTFHAAYLVPVVCRTNGINAPELTTPEGKDAAAYSATLLNLNVVYRAKLSGREKYGRLLADVQLSDGRWLSAAMLSANKAKPYDGKGPKP
jgi:endonuclease YncB( thermonuclease family)